VLCYQNYYSVVARDGALLHGVSEARGRWMDGGTSQSLMADSAHEGGDLLGQTPLFLLLLMRRADGTMHASIRFPYIWPGTSTLPGSEDLT
jgi:hypothetical protein